MAGMSIAIAFVSVLCICAGGQGASLHVFYVSTLQFGCFAWVLWCLQDGVSMVAFVCCRGVCQTVLVPNRCEELCALVLY